MNRDEHINSLFELARQEAPLTSFEDTKAAFLQNVQAIPQANTGKSWLNFKNIWIMTATLSILIFIGSLLFSHNSAQKSSNLNNQKSTQIHVEKTTTIGQNALEKEGKSIESKTELVAHNLKLIDDFLDQLPPRQNPDTKVGINHLPQESNDNYDYFPKLTPEEIDANNKQKRKMVKAIAKRDKKYLAYIPAGSFTIDKEDLISVQAFYIQTNEVTNLEYRTFLFDLLISGDKEAFNRAKPDQNAWVNVLGESTKAMVENYFSDPVYNEYPVVNISREGAEMYCSWLTKAVNSEIDNDLEKINDLRIPTRAEWNYAASSGGSQKPFPWDGKYLRNEKGCFLANFDESSYSTRSSADTVIRDGAAATAKTGTYVSNTYGLYNMSGNVAEMVYNSNGARENPGTAGGSWLNTETEIKIGAPDPYKGITTAHPGIGFRIVFTRLPKKVEEFINYYNWRNNQKTYDDSLVISSFDDDEKINEKTVKLTEKGWAVKLSYSRRNDGSIKRWHSYISLPSGEYSNFSTGKLRQGNEIIIKWFKDEDNLTHFSTNIRTKENAFLSDITTAATDTQPYLYNDSVTIISTTTDNELKEVLNRLSSLGCSIETDYKRRLNGEFRKFSVHIKPNTGGQLIIRINPFRKSDEVKIRWYLDPKGEIHF